MSASHPQWNRASRSDGMRAGWAAHRVSSPIRIAISRSSGDPPHLSHGVVLAVEAERGGLGAVGGESGDDLSGVADIAACPGGGSGCESKNGGDLELHGDRGSIVLCIVGEGVAGVEEYLSRWMDRSMWNVVVERVEETKKSRCCFGG